MRSKILAACLVAIQVVSTYAQTNMTIVKTKNGLLQGITEASGIHSFKGVPFAQPPVGNLRWQEPQAPKNWEGVRKADHFGPQAMQPHIYADMIFRSDGVSEDCLYLNVWTPAKTVNEKLPVLVYFYGGGFLAGDGSEYRYDGESMAKRGIVAVTVNYRLGIFGFFAHPELSKASGYHGSGNYGLMDQHAALLWVQQNIAAFGGDPGKVTIGGESAGAMSVCAQVASPLSKGLFRAAIAESGSLMGGLAPTPLAKAEQNGVAFMERNKIASLTDLRNMPAEQLMKLGGRFSVDVDGYLLPDQPLAIFEAGKQMHVSLLAGWNSSEADVHGFLGNNVPITVADYQKAVQKAYAGHADEVLKLYPAANDAEVAQVATDLATDRFMGYATWKFGDLQSKTGGGVPVYRYFFKRQRPNTTGFGAVHSAEIEYALGNLSTNKVYPWTADDYQISETMQSYFANFIKSGDPNGKGLPAWHRIPERMNIDVKSESTPDKNNNRYLFWDAAVKP